MIITHDKKQLPSLRALNAFVATARLGSFTSAAHELNVTQGAVSRQVQELERMLGLNLFTRCGPNLKLTAVGDEFAERSARVLGDLQNAVASVKKGLISNHVTLSMLPSVAAKWLAPRLGDFVTQHPHIDLRISASRHLVNFRAEGIDASIRYGRGQWPDQEAELLGHERIFPVCTAAYAQRLQLSIPSDLARATLFHTDIKEDWAAWFQSADLSALSIPRGPMLADDTTMLQAVIGGQGAALGRSILVADDIAQGRLVCPFDISLKASFSYWFVWPEEVELSADLIAVKNWFKHEFKQDRSYHCG